MAADRAGIGELPAGLRADHPAIDQAFLGEPVGGVAVMVLRAEKIVREPHGTSPERKGAVRYAAIEFGRHGEAIVPVVLRVGHARRDLVPDRAPGRRAVKPEPLRKAGGVTERKIEA